MYCIIDNHQSTCAVSSSKDTVVFNFVSFLRMTKQDPNLCSIHSKSSTINANENARQLHTEPSCDFILSTASLVESKVQHNTVQYIIVYCPEESHKERLRRKEVRYTVQHEKDEPRQTKTKQKKSQVNE